MSVKLHERLPSASHISRLSAHIRIRIIFNTVFEFFADMYGNNPLQIKEGNGMNTNYSLNAYRSHELAIEMRTSSGDVINLDFANRQSLAMEHSVTEGTRESSFSFASMQSFQFKVDSNGIDEQGKKEIAAFMEIARPYIENFMEELEADEQHTPLNQVAKAVGDLLPPAAEKNENSKNYAKNGIVNLIDNSLRKFEQHDKLLDGSQKLLEKILQRFDKVEDMLYA